MLSCVFVCLVAVHQHTVEKYKKVLNQQTRQIQTLQKRLAQADENLKTYTGDAELQKELEAIAFHKEELKKENSSMKVHKHNKAYKNKHILHEIISILIIVVCSCL